MILEEDDPKSNDGDSGSGSDNIGSTSTETHRDGGTTVPKTEI